MEKGKFNLEYDPLGRLVLQRPSEADVVDVRLRRAFPWSHPGQLVSVRNSEGKELLLVESLAELPAPLRELMEKYLAKWAFVPKILRVVRVDLRFGSQNWQVETDRGVMEFRVQEREDLRFMGDGRFSIKDVDGCVYELPPLEKLDEKSRHAVEVLL